MLLWICFAVLTAVVVAYVMQPLRRSQAPVAEPETADVAIYRHQLEELEAEKERGLVAAEELEGARAEVARRLLKGAEAETSAAGGPTKADHTPKLFAAVAAILPTLAVGIYLLTGAPGVPSRPYAERQAAPVADKSIVDIIARVEQELRARPDDGQGWDVIAPVYLRIGRYADAAYAYAQANRILGETPKRLMGFAEATLLAEDGVVSEPVRRAALRVLQLEPDRIEPKVWIGLAKEQDGDLKGAIEIYRDLVEKAPADAPYRAALNERLAMVGRKLNGEPEPQQAPAASSASPAADASPATPPPADPGELARMAPEQRQAFINQMVEGLAGRLRENGRDLDGWLRLARAYKVLGRESDAAAAIGEARRNFAGDAKALETIEAAAKTIGIGS